MGDLMLSLCIPTNGVSEWVLPVLDSIYKQNVDNDIFEVIVSDNGQNKLFKEKMECYCLLHDNLKYKQTTSYMFYNQLEALKSASGKYIKLLNHRSSLKENSITYFIDFIKKYENSEPVVYFSNGSLGGKSYHDKNFNDFVAHLGYLASWTTGVGIWKDKLDAMPKNIKIDQISPHSCILFSDKQNNNYIIDDFVFCVEIDNSHMNKGKYDLYKAFGVEEFLITLNLYADGDIDAKTVKIVKKEYENFLSQLYWEFSIRKKPCSYIIDDLKDSGNIIYSRKSIIMKAYIYGISCMLKKIKRRK